ncbi:MAG: precorrin-8X methylmutase [Treponema sp.]|jgi:precorrin-8X/cobalt-precorrin-8 methylmutase|nr:precorrin-8X methylmutase [Treponema sp.]
MNFITNPVEIEKRSFDIITEKLVGRQLDQQNANVIKRVIHSTADFDYADNLVFSDNAVAIAKAALKNGAQIVTDTQMAKAGINKKVIELLGCTVHCFIDAPEVSKAAQEKGVTRARAAVDMAVETLSGETPTAPIVFVIGNAPTALIRLHELICAGKSAPTMIVAVPVGFVNVVEAKELILNLQVPYIVARGQKGGSNVAAAIINALLYETTERTLP